MLLAQDIERLLQGVAEMDRPHVVHALHAVPCPFPIDFTDDYLATMSIERLRHLLVAVCLHVKVMPPELTAAQTAAADYVGRSAV